MPRGRPIGQRRHNKGGKFKRRMLMIAEEGM